MQPEIHFPGPDRIMEIILACITDQRCVMNLKLRKMCLELHEMNLGLCKISFRLRGKSLELHEINLSCEVLDSASSYLITLLPTYQIQF